jgi:DNA adenine methylase
MTKREGRSQSSLPSPGNIFDSERAINVKSVRMISPFRYPGGKTWFVPYFERYFKQRGRPIRELIEPFAGGASVSLTAISEGWAKHATLGELDPDVASVWQTILSGHGRWLANRVRTFAFSAESVEQVLTGPTKSTRTRAFATILRNRIQRGGILHPSARVLNKGERNNGINSRWYPETLGTRIDNITSLKSKIRFVAWDGMKLLNQKKHLKTATYFIDPPYAVAGRRLYPLASVEPRALFALVAKLEGDPIITYEDTPEIRSLGSEFGLEYCSVPMMNTHHATRQELIIGRDVDWIKKSD